MQVEVSASDIKSGKKADDRGRVTLGSEHAGQTVTVAVLEVEDEDDVRTDGGRSAGNPETRLGEARKQLRILLDDVEFEDEDTAEFVEGALACAESAAVCLEGEDAARDDGGAGDDAVTVDVETAETCLRELGILVDVTEDPENEYGDPMSPLARARSRPCPRNPSRCLPPGRRRKD
jgi:hypothetical protein